MTIHAMLARQIVQLWSHGDLGVVAAMYAPDCRDHMPVPGQAGGHEGLAQAVRLFRDAMPDLSLTLIHTLAQGTPDAGWGVDVWTLTGTHTGADLFGLPAQGRAVAFAGIDWLRVEAGQVRDLWHVEDMATMADQLGLAMLPPPAPAPLPGETLVIAGPQDADVRAVAMARLADGWRTGRDAGALALQALAATTPDLAVHTAALLIDGPLAAARLVLAGTDAASGRAFAIHAMDVIAVSAGAITHAWHVADQFSRRSQLA